MVPTPMQPPARVYATPPLGWGRPPRDAYGGYHYPVVTPYPSHLHHPQQIFASQQSYEYQEQFDLDDHEMENVVKSRPTEGARQDH
jgi:hypothetical protein